MRVLVRVIEEAYLEAPLVRRDTDGDVTISRFVSDDDDAAAAVV